MRVSNLTRSVIVRRLIVCNLNTIHGGHLSRTEQTETRLDTHIYNVGSST